MKTVQQSGELLSIEDIIENLPDDTAIEEISDELCNSLEQSNTKVKQLEDKMERTSKITDKVKQEIKSLQERPVTISEEAPCSISKLPIKGRKYYTFRDGTCFLDQVLFDYVKKTPLPVVQAGLINKIEQDLQETEDPLLRTTRLKEREDIMLVGNPFYSEYFVKSVREPFIKKNDNEIRTEILAWKL